MRGVQGQRAPLLERPAELKAISAPTLVIAGDEDDSTLETALFLKRNLPRCGLLMLPKTGHTINLEEPAAFNAAVGDFLHAIERSTWGERDATARERYVVVPKDK